MFMAALALLLAATPWSPAPAGAQQPRQLSGVVLDVSGVPVVGATVAIEEGDVSIVSTETVDGGRFTIACPPGESLFLVVTSPGFAVARVRIAAAAAVDLILHPAGLHETVSVTASRGAGELATASSSSALTAAEIANSAAGATDDVLRNTPGFGLTRRSSSRVANPSTQGVSMRGLPGNAGSRTLVLADGLALNDQFGGWVYWNRVPEAAIERIEVVRGASGDLYGGDAVSGVIQVFAFSPAQSRFHATVDAASPRTTRGSFFGSHHVGGWQAAIAGEWVGTDGAAIVAAAERGAVDVNATSNYRTGFATGGYTGQRWQVRGRVAAYVERRGNGTRLVVNSTNWRQYSGEASSQMGGGHLTAQVSWGRQNYFNNFSSVPATRATERVTSEQWVPSRFRSAAAQWRRTWKSTLFLIGGDHKQTDGDVTEYKFAPTGVRSGPVVTGGREGASSVYGRAAIAASRTVSIVAGIRGDFWRSTPVDTSAISHAVNFFSPRVAVSWQWHPSVALRAAVTRASRTPTLDELHRSSQIGNTFTSGNPLLDPERLTGVEAGALWTTARASARFTGFWNNLTDAITNITLSSTPALITKEKQNSDTVRARGLEIEAEYRAVHGIGVSGWLTLISSRYRDEIKLPALEGHRVPQIPFYQAALAVTYANPRLVTIVMQARAAGMQYEDDLNTLPLTPFTVADLSVTRTIGRGMQGYLAFENLFDAEIQTGRTPVTKIGWPRTIRIGVRFTME